MNCGVYLLHFTRPVAHATHYIGWSENVPARIEQHLDGRGSPLVAAAIEGGGDVQVAQLWPGANRAFERQLKNRRNARGICPVCRPAYNEESAERMRRSRGRS